MKSLVSTIVAKMLFYNQDDMNRLSSIVIVLFIVTCPAFTQTSNTPPSSRARVAWQPPTWDFANELPAATVPKEMVGALRVSNFPIEFEETKMDDVRTRLGGTIGHKGDAGEYLEWLCFHGTDSGGRWVLWLESGEIDGGMVGSFQWQHLAKDADLDQRCRMLQHAAIELPIALRLGIAEKEVLKTLGAPTVRRGNRLIYVHEHEETIRGEPFTSYNIVAVLLRSGKVLAIEVSKTVSS